MVNRGEEKVRVHMNVVPRSTTFKHYQHYTFVFPVLRGTTFIILESNSSTYKQYCVKCFSEYGKVKCYPETFSA